MTERDTTPSPPPAPALPPPEQLGNDLGLALEQLLGRPLASLSLEEASKVGMVMVHMGLSFFRVAALERGQAWALMMRALSTYACPCETCAAAQARVAREAATKKARQN